MFETASIRTLNNQIIKGQWGERGGMKYRRLQSFESASTLLSGWSGSTTEFKGG
jgi:hypothetical protein